MAIIVILQQDKYLIFIYIIVSIMNIIIITNIEITLLQTYSSCPSYYSKSNCPSIVNS